jgi:3-deoxy-7-phosphoheptulonate synthase
MNSLFAYDIPASDLYPVDASDHPIVSPRRLRQEMPIEGTSVQLLVNMARSGVRRIVSRRDDRLLVIVGPCSIHDPAAALDYARLLRIERERHADSLEIVMRAYFEKPRTVGGWKGLVNDPYMDQSYRIEDGLRIARKLLLEINQLGVPTAGEFLDTISPHYLGDIMSWAAIGARTTESQVHRELASSHLVPIGFKNGTDGNVRIAIDAMRASALPHCFLSVNGDGRVTISRTQGNDDCHIILRGGKEPNYAAASVLAASQEIEKHGLDARIMIDLSHGNSSKRFERQVDVCDDVCDQLRAGNEAIVGVMLEGHLHEGVQPFVAGLDDPAKLRYGVSITDACLGWRETQSALAHLAQAVRMRRSVRVDPESVHGACMASEVRETERHGQPTPALS